MPKNEATEKSLNHQAQMTHLQQNKKKSDLVPGKTESFQGLKT
jgi:hypothetical protein